VSELTAVLREYLVPLPHSCACARALSLELEFLPRYLLQLVLASVALSLKSSPPSLPLVVANASLPLEMS
jgi:hypothetical protein